jgi:hypothetical protein
VQLDGSLSSDLDGDPLTFSWSFVSVPPGSAASVIDPSSVSPAFVADLAGTYIVQLVVNDGEVDSAADTVTISTRNTAPVANAGPDQSVSLGQTVMLDGSGSSDVDGNALTFAWSFVSRPAGSAAALSNPDAVQPTFVADVAGSYVLQLIVNDGALGSTPDTSVISTENTPPVANAGADQTPPVQAEVSLDGSASSDADGNALTFTWSFVARPAGSAAVLIDPGGVNPHFLVDLPGTYVVQLMVNDGIVNSAPDTVSINTVNSRPSANAGPDQSAAPGGTVNLDGSASSDADGNSLTFSWSFTSRPAASAAALSDPAAVHPTFVADVQGTYVLQLIVNDGQLGSPPDTVTITATVANSMSLTLEGPIVGVGDTLSGTVTLAEPAPSGGVTVNLSSTDNAVATVAPGSVTIPAAGTQASFTVTGVADGSTDIVATAAGFPTVSIPIASTSSLISIDSIPTVTPNQTLEFAVSITKPAPTGGVTIHFTSSDPAVATVTPSVTVPEGLRVPSANPQITGVSIGTAVITAEAINFAPDTRTAVVSIVLSFSPGSLTLAAGTTKAITLHLASPAPTGGLTVNLATDNAAIATVPPTATVPQGQNSTEVIVTGVADGSTTLRANKPGVAEATAQIVVATGGITLENLSVGDDLQVSANHGVLGLPAPPVVGVDVTITSADPARLLVSANPNTVGSASVTLHVNGGATGIPPFVLQALDDTGTVQITATASGYTTAAGTITLAPSGFVIVQPPSISTNTFAANTTVQIRAVRLVPGSLNFAEGQPLRPGVTAEVPVTSSDTNVGTMTVSPVIFGANVGESNTAFDPVGAGTTTIAVGTPAGFDTPGNARQITATVTAPTITGPFIPHVGEDLQMPSSIALNTAPPSPVDVTVTVASGTVARVSDDGTVLGGTTVTIPAVANTSSRTIFLQGLLKGTTTLTISAPGYATNTQTLTVDASGFVINGPAAINTNSFAANTNVEITAALLNPVTFTRVSNQQVRAGLTVLVPVTSSDTTVGTITVSPLSFGGNVASLATAFDPLGAGTTTLAVGTPAGFDTPNNLRQITATVTAPTIRVPTNPLIGEDLQDDFFVFLDTPPPNPVDITVTVGSGAIVRVSDNGTVLGGTTVTFPGVANTSTRTIFLQGLLQGTTTLTVSAPGYSTNTQTIRVDPSGFVVTIPGFPTATTLATNTFAANSELRIEAARLQPGTLDYSFTQRVRAGLTVVVSVTSSDTTVGTMTASPLSFGANVGVVSTFFDPLTAGVTAIAAEVPSGFDVPHTRREIAATVTAPAITGPVSPRIGEDLQQNFSIFLTATPPSPVDVTVTISSGVIARVSDNATVLGGTTLTFPGVANTNGRTIFLQGLTVGTTTLTVSAPGYATNVQTIAVDPSGFVISAPASINTTASAANTTVSIAASRLDPVTQNAQPPFNLQAVRAGLTVQVLVTSSDTGAGVMTVSLLAFGPGTTSLNTQFDPLMAGSTTITVGTPAGFDTPNNLRQITATVNP